MPSSIVQSFAKKSNKSPQYVEKKWEELSKQYDKDNPSKKGDSDKYEYVVGILKKILNIDDKNEAREYKVDDFDIDDIKILSKRIGIENISTDDAYTIMKGVYKQYGRDDVTDDKITKAIKQYFDQEEESQGAVTTSSAGIAPGGPGVFAPKLMMVGRFMKGKKYSWNPAKDYPGQKKKKKKKNESFIEYLDNLIGE